MFKTADLPTKILGISFLALLAYLPFHAVISTWLISNFGSEVFFKGAKELFLFGFILPVSLYVLAKDSQIFRKLWSSAINKLIVAYVALNFILISANGAITKSEFAGLVFNIRFFAMFLLAQLLVMKLAQKQLQELSLRFVLYGGAVVALFGALQVLVLPNDFLRHFGYGQNIIPPYFTIDNNENFVRILSTLRGPNALGAYLVFWLPILLVVTKRMWHVAVKYRIWAIAIWGASLMTMYASGSRSAWLGALVSISLAGLLLVKRVTRKKILIGMAGIAVVASIVLAATWNTHFVQTTLWHNDPSESSGINSDNQRQESLRQSVDAIVSAPLGNGVGATNIASTYGSNPVTVENYYLQVAQELGILGLLLFMSVAAMTALALWRQRSLDITAALLAGLAGLSIVGLLLPVWGDETVSMLWWGMAGLCVFPAIKKSRRKSDATKSNK